MTLDDWNKLFVASGLLPLRSDEQLDEALGVASQPMTTELTVLGCKERLAWRYVGYAQVIRHHTTP